MNGITINIDPVFARLGQFELRWYSVVLIVAMLAAIHLSAREAQRKGISPQEIYNLAPWVLISGLVGARLFHVIDTWDYDAANPAQILMFQQGGLAIWGGLAGGVVAAIVYTRARHIPLGLLADTIVPALLVAQIIGRVACIINGDAYGGVTDLPWGFIYVHPGAMIPPSLAGVPTHPYPVYEMIWNGVALAVLLRLRYRLNTDGLLSLMYLCWYGLGRFLLTFVRQENVWFWGLQEAQVLALGIMTVAIIFLIRAYRKERQLTIGSGT